MSERRAKDQDEAVAGPVAGRPAKPQDETPAVAGDGRDARQPARTGAHGKTTKNQG
jgi:hypothetical protein